VWSSWSIPSVTQRRTENTDFTDTIGSTEIFYHLTPALSTKKGLYSYAHKGRIRKAAFSLSHTPIIEDDPSYVPSKGWAEMIRKVYEVDPLCCPSCNGQMRIISFIEEPKIIDKIIVHLELTFEAEQPPPPHNVQLELLMEAEERGEYF
jgi:hypothetical protein